MIFTGQFAINYMAPRRAKVLCTTLPLQWPCAIPFPARQGKEEDGVKTRLQDLKDCKDQYEVDFPRQHKLPDITTAPCDTFPYETGEGGGWGYKQD